MIPERRPSQTPAETPAETVYLLPGQARIASVPTRFTTILGSCVAVCLFDPLPGLGGINHFLLPGGAPAPGDDPLRWGEPATEWLVTSMLARGARAATLEAKVFGGAHLARTSGSASNRIGDRNVASAFAALDRLGIRIVARAVGGHWGRKVVFESHTGSVFVRELRR